MNDWGSVAGDTNADAIIRDRRRGDTTLGWLRLASIVVLVAAASAYTDSGAPGALAGLVIAATFAIGMGVASRLYETHTFVMIAERRAQLLEQEVADLRQDVRDLLGRR